MKLRFLLAVVAMMVGSMVYAQQPEPRTGTERGEQRERPTAEQIAKRQTDKMQKELGLNDEQYAKLYKLNLKQNKRQAKQWRKSMAQRESFREGLEQILTKEQYDKLKQARRKQWQGRHDKAKRGEGRRGEWRRGEAPCGNCDSTLTLKGEKMEPIRPKDNPRGKARNGAYME